MSFYTADHRVIKIKKEFQEDFYNLYNCNYDKILPIITEETLEEAYWSEE